MVKALSSRHWPLDQAKDALSNHRLKTAPNSFRSRDALVLPASAIAQINSAFSYKLMTVRCY
jgi:hypothetical protein